MMSTKKATVATAKQGFAGNPLFELAHAIALISSLVLLAVPSFAQESTYEPSIGDRFAIRQSYETTSESSTGSKGSSSGSNVIVEHVLGVRGEGFVIEFDLAEGLPEADKARNWQFPVRVFRPAEGPMQILNSPELEARVEAWLQKYRMTREACGTWTFSWTAYYIECDPHSVIDMLKPFDLRVNDLSDGAPYDDEMAIAPGPLEKTVGSTNRESYSAVLQIDPDVVRRQRAESDVVAGEILGEPVALEAALAIQQSNELTGTIHVTLEADRDGNIWRRTKVVEVETKLANGEIEKNSSTEVVERQKLQ